MPPDDYDSALAGAAFPFYFDRAEPGEVAMGTLVFTLRQRARNMIAARSRRGSPPTLEEERMIDTVEAAYTTAANALRKTPTFRELTEEQRTVMERELLTIAFENPA